MDLERLPRLHQEGRCPGCQKPAAELRDARGRLWHLGCAVAALGQVPAQVGRPARDKGALRGGRRPRLRQLEMLSALSGCGVQ